jgi:hypothetical protein
MYYVSATANWYQMGGVRGLAKSDFLVMSTGGTVNLGDTMSVGGNTWTVISSGGSSNAKYLLVRAT